MLKSQKAEQVRPGSASPLQVPLRGSSEFCLTECGRPLVAEDPTGLSSSRIAIKVALGSGDTAPPPQVLMLSLSLHTPTATAANLPFQRKQDRAFYAIISILRIDFIRF